MNEAQRSERRVDRLVGRLRRLLRLPCRHMFAMQDLHRLPGATDNDAIRVMWTCDRCGEVFTGHSGLQVAASNRGKIVRREQLPNS